MNGEETYVETLIHIMHTLFTLNNLQCTSSLYVCVRALPARSEVISVIQDDESSLGENAKILSSSRLMQPNGKCLRIAWAL